MLRTVRSAKWSFMVTKPLCFLVKANLVRGFSSFEFGFVPAGRCGEVRGMPKPMGRTGLGKIRGLRSTAAISLGDAGRTICAGATLWDVSVDFRFFAACIGCCAPVSKLPLAREAQWVAGFGG